MTEIYPAGEDPLQEYRAKNLAEGIKEHGHRDVRFVDAVDTVPAVLAEELGEGDSCLTLGCRECDGNFRSNRGDDP